MLIGSKCTSDHRTKQEYRQNVYNGYHSVFPKNRNSRKLNKTTTTHLQKVLKRTDIVLSIMASFDTLIYGMSRKLEKTSARLATFAVSVCESVSRVCEA